MLKIKLLKLVQTVLLTVWVLLLRTVILVGVPVSGLSDD